MKKTRQALNKKSIFQYTMTRTMTGMQSLQDNNTLKVSKIIGKKVVNPKGDYVGIVQDVLIDKESYSFTAVVVNALTGETLICQDNHIQDFSNKGLILDQVK